VRQRETSLATPKKKAELPEASNTLNLFFLQQLGFKKEYIVFGNLTIPHTAFWVWNSKVLRPPIF
jgi:hypothetical protein